MYLHMFYKTFVGLNIMNIDYSNFSGYLQYLLHSISLSPFNDAPTSFYSKIS